MDPQPLAYETVTSPVTSPVRLSSPLRLSFPTQFDSSDSDASLDDYDSMPKKLVSTPTKRMSTPRKADCTPTPRFSTPASFVSTSMQSVQSPLQFLSSPSHIVHQIHLPSDQKNDDDICDDSAPLLILRSNAVSICRKVFRCVPKEEQLEVVYNIEAKRDSVLIAPCGWGKTLAFFLPMVLWPRSVTVIISPLISLMEDQQRVAFKHYPIRK